MPRQKISEFRAKTIVAEALDANYKGWSVDTNVKLTGIKGHKSYVVKVDQAVKGRFKKGLVLLGLKKEKLAPSINKLVKKGYSSFLVEPEVSHDQSEEKYLSISYNREGFFMSYSEKGGVDIEQNADSVKTTALNNSTDWTKLSAATGLSSEKLKALFKLFIDGHFCFLEINPYLVSGDVVTLLDCAIEVDDAGGYFAHQWQEEDIRRPHTGKVTNAERAVRELDANSPASFNLNVFNKDGSIFLLLSGGGASVVIADEIYNQGYGPQLANYGEYSGGPNTEETHEYSKHLLQLLIDSKAKRKVLFIGGAVANFTDIAKTFNGIIRSIDELSDKLKKQNVKVYVRRGGPRQEIGLAKMRECLERNGLLGEVNDVSVTLSEAVSSALGGLK